MGENTSMRENASPDLSDASEERLVWSRDGGAEPPAVRWMHAIESASWLDGVGAVLGRLVTPISRGPVQSLLLGSGTGHAVHPVLTDLPVGLWTSTAVLDLCGGRRSRPAADLLLATGILASVPTALTGLAEWAQTPRPESRVGSLHAALNLAALSLYAVSWTQRRRGRHGRGVAVGLAAMGVASAAGYLGGHLATARKAGSRDPAFERDGVGPVLHRPPTG